MRFLSRVAVIACLAASASGAFFTAQAVSQAFGTGGGGCCLYADNSAHWFAYCDAAASTTVTESRRVNVLNPTDMNSSVETCSPTNTQTDVKVHDWTESSNPDAGSWVCTNTAGTAAGQCQQGLLWFNLSVTPSNQTACQEIGHSTGLSHAPSSPNNTCMRNPPSVTTWNPHEVDDHINNRW